MTQPKLCDKNPNWKGDNVGRDALHDWIKRRFPKPELCEMCKNRKSYDLANISSKYLRDLTDWQWLCRSCHMKSDGRMNQLYHGGPKPTDMSKRMCSLCNSNRTTTQHNNRLCWYRINNELVCHKCYERRRRQRLRSV